MHFSLRGALGLCFLVALGACTLPRGAALQSEIVTKARDENASFDYLPVTRTSLATIAHWPEGLHARPQGAWPRASRGSADPLIAPGDTVQLTIWESGENKLLSPPESPVAGLRQTRVSAGGTIFVPYLGTTEVAGKTPTQARADVQQKLAALIPDAQVELDAVPGPGRTVALIGGVRQPGKVALANRDLSVLDLLSEGGGPDPKFHNPQLRLIRGGKVYRASLATVLDSPSLDTRLLPGDKLSVEEDDRYFLALGATGKETLIPFGQARLSALEAVTLAGGLSDNRADPKGLMILREYPRAALRGDLGRGPTKTRVIFAVDLTTSDGLFSAQNLPIEPRDIVLATESPAVPARTFLGLIGSSVGVANSVSNVAN
ncbi:MAG: polysaccharide export protein [Thioclava sp.]|nr:polysaccharide biosynthesis/export family protein [Thioclava sp.]MBD3803881.1 polysaccharide export protein [Thioclava sp.]